MNGIKRTVRKYGKCLGHRAGEKEEKLLIYSEARQLIYLPTYRWLIENCLIDVVTQLNQLAETNSVILLDYETNGEVKN